MYDHSDPNYKNSVFVERGWQDVSKEYGEPVGDCKKKWRHLRSSLSRYLKSSKDSLRNKNNKLKPYYLLTHMDFLVPYTKTLDSKNDSVVSNKYESNDDEADGGNQMCFGESQIKSEEQQTAAYDHEIIQEDDSQTMEEDDDTNIVYETFEIQEAQIPTSSASSQSQAKSQITLVRSSHAASSQATQQIPLTINTISNAPKVQQQSQTQFSVIPQQQQQQQASMSTTQTIPMQNTIIPIPDDQGSADLNFFLALLPDIKQMTNEQKRKLRIGVLNLIDTILSGN